MRSLSDWDHFPYEPQEEDSLTCVPCSVAMVCQYWGLQKDWDTIIDELDYNPEIGTPFENVGLLSGIRTLRVGQLEETTAHLDLLEARPVVANLLIGNDAVLGYSSPQRFQHAVVIIGISRDHVTFFD
ncbi:MAG TPA: C39 family peptidase, partial [Fimbriimonadaceae bacterium]|nr:C39 family peptidase [Fimbriimonadaceae bacterium]